MKHLVPPDHPRRESILTRELLVEGYAKHIVAGPGLIAHGRGEAFDYLIGEATRDFAAIATEAAAAAILLATHPVISVNGNAAMLVPDDLVGLAQVSKAELEVNLFYRTRQREYAIRNVLRKHGAHRILGVGKNASSRIPELGSERRRVDPLGIAIADTVLVPLEDGDRTEALVRMGKTVITIDLNPLSRTSLSATITIVDNLVRALPRITAEIKRLAATDREKLKEIIARYDNKSILSRSLDFIRTRLADLSKGFMEREKGEGLNQDHA